MSKLYPDDEEGQAKRAADEAHYCHLGEAMRNAEGALNTNPQSTSATDPAADAAKSEDRRAKWTLASGDEMFLVGEDGVGLSAAGHVIVKPLREWHALASTRPQPAPPATPINMDAAYRLAKGNASAYCRGLAESYPDAAHQSLVNLAEEIESLETRVSVPPPPAGEPDAIYAAVEGAVSEKWHLLQGLRYVAKQEIVKAVVQAISRLGLAARPKVDDAKVRDYAMRLRAPCWKLEPSDLQHVAAESADLLERLARLRQQALDENAIIRKARNSAEAKLTECEAELAKADAVIAEYVKDDVIFDAEKEPTLKTFDNQRDAQRRHAARQQKASAEPAAAPSKAGETR